MNRIHLFCIALAAALCSCGGPMALPAERKKLPGDESTTSIPLPNAADDSATMNLVNTYKPMAVPLLAQWAQQGGTGVTIDLRADATRPALRAEYRVERAQEFSIPVEFVWDAASAGRAAVFIRELESWSAVSVRSIGSASGNCFQP
ncbi:hypothetical protein ACFOTA_04030 [Chitinophaga sp. GCM10012297]|uniref:Uncharacterized protein n=1 Tax=Chitinophaga chungangae TaxID=2821488 RepID=A0ABS3Y9K3_9BACT|nr:hypothetical protein [Chitinophaga chungangae]MBO9151363.1 hypothetical protein [Chitinophaga chungangae]